MALTLGAQTAPTSLLEFTESTKKSLKLANEKKILELRL